MLVIAVLLQHSSLFELGFLNTVKKNILLCTVLFLKNIFTVVFIFYGRFEEPYLAGLFCG